MTTLTVQLDDELLQRTRQMAETRHTTVDSLVADALSEVSQRWNGDMKTAEDKEARLKKFENALAKFSGHDTGGPFTRDEMNER
jgi:predicted transcriptional regulator